MNFPDRGRSLEMPPREPLVYRLYEIVQNYGYAYKSVINEKFGDGIMSAISFSTKVEKETDEKGEWVKITLRGKWCVYGVCLDLWIAGLIWLAGFPSLASRVNLDLASGVRFELTSRVNVSTVYIGKYESLPNRIISQLLIIRAKAKSAVTEGCSFLSCSDCTKRVAECHCC